MKRSRQECKVNQWQQESPAKEYLEQVQCCHDTDCNEPMMKRLHRFEEWDMGRVYGNFEEKDENFRMGFRQVKRGFRGGSIG